MNYEEIVKWLRSNKVETGSLLCLGCGYEHNCGIRGCAVMRAAADAMENMQTENAALRRTIDNLTSAQAVVLKEFEAKLEELAEVKAERDALAERNRSAYEIAWGCDIPSPTVPEYVELHEGMTRVMEALKGPQKEA